LQREGAVAYMLQLPERASILLVFLVSLLKGKLGNNVVTASIMPLTDEGEGGRVKLFWKKS